MCGIFLLLCFVLLVFSWVSAEEVEVREIAADRGSNVTLLCGGLLKLPTSSVQWVHRGNRTHHEILVSALQLCWFLKQFFLLESCKTYFIKSKNNFAIVFKKKGKCKRILKIWPVLRKLILDVIVSALTWITYLLSDLFNNTIRRYSYLINLQSYVIHDIIDTRVTYNNKINK